MLVGRGASELGIVCHLVHSCTPLTRDLVGGNRLTSDQRLAAGRGGYYNTWSAVSAIQARPPHPTPPLVLFGILEVET